MQITDSQQHAKMAKSIRDIYTNGEPFGTRLGDGVRVWLLIQSNNPSNTIF